MSVLCAFSMLGNSAAVVAQSKDKKQEPKSITRQEPGVPNAVFLIGEPPTEPDLHIAFGAPGQEVAYAAPQGEFIHSEFSFDGKVVEGAPYSADAVTETIQTLGDGNRIVRNSSAKIYRDSAGRTRREQAMKMVGPWAASGEASVKIFINDPVSGVGYSLDSNTKTAHKMMTFQAFNLSGDMKAGAELKARMKDMKPKAANGVEAGAVATGIGAETVTGSAANAGAGAVAPGVPISVANGVIDWSGGAEVNRESLGTQTIEGVVAEGTRITFTTPAGKIGNERPIVTTNERWYSPELQTVVLIKNSDPRMGETTYRLTNIVRSECDPSLFQVPADYKVEESGFGLRTGPPAPPRIELEKRVKRPSDN